jgi:transcriptional regulator with XRE-family HTH domain
MPALDPERLKAYRVKRGISREALGRATGLSAWTIMRIETGETKDPGIVTLTLITKALLIDIDDVMKKEEEVE